MGDKVLVLHRLHLVDGFEPGAPAFDPEVFVEQRAAEPFRNALAAQGLLLGAALAFSGGAMRTRVYIDGLNLYYGAVKGTPFKWLDPVRLSALVLPQACVVERLLYFTAHVSGVVDPGAPARQKEYIRHAEEAENLAFGPKGGARPKREDKR